MNVSFFSLFMATIFSTVFILAVHALRKNKFFLQGFGVLTVLLLYTLCTGRMLFPIELPFAMPIRLQAVYNQFYQAVGQAEYRLAGHEWSILEFARGIWILGTVGCLLFFLIQYGVSLFRLRRFENNRNLQAEKILKEVQEEVSCKKRIHLFIYPRVEIPKGIGIIHKSILLPAKDYTKQELYYILFHEYMHFCNHDQIVKLLIHIFRCVFWWNPLVYLLEVDVEDILEIKCDLAVTKHFCKRKKTQYMHVLKQVLKDADDEGKSWMMPSIVTQLFKRRRAVTMVERFYMVMNQPKDQAVKMFRIGFFILCIAVVLASYTFILQPYYDSPPTEDIYTHSSVYETNLSGGYILHHKDGGYSFIKENEMIFDMKYETVQVFLKAGYDIREE